MRFGQTFGHTEQTTSPPTFSLANNAYGHQPWKIFDCRVDGPLACELPHGLACGFPTCLDFGDSTELR